MEYKEITINDLLTGEISRSAKKVKQRVYSIVKNNIVFSISQSMNIDNDNGNLDNFAKSAANEHANNLMKGDFAVMQSLATAFKHVMTSEKLKHSDDDNDHHVADLNMAEAEVIIASVNQLIRSQTTKLIKKIDKAIHDEKGFDFDSLIKIKGISWDKVAMLYLTKEEHSRIDIKYIKAFLKYEVFIKKADNEHIAWLTRSEIKKEIMAEVLDDLYEKTDNPQQTFNNLLDTILNDSETVKEVPLSTLHIEEMGYASAEIYSGVKTMLTALSERVYTVKPLIENINNLEKVDNIIKRVESQNDFNFNLEQREGIYMACQNSVSVITGSAGTGKSASVKAIVEIYKRLSEKKVMGAAFTGQATNNLRQSVNFDATECGTLHRWMAMNDFMLEEERTLPSYDEVELLVIDEFSMVELDLINSVLRRIKDNKNVKILFVGHVGQLPAINIGFAFEFIGSNIGQRISYKEVVRQAKDSVVAMMANEVDRGIHPENLTNKDYRAKNFRFLSAVGYETIIEKCTNAYLYYIEKYPEDKKDIHILANTRILVKSINESIQEKLIDKGAIDTERYYANAGMKIHRGDRVIFTKNTMHLETGTVIFNGAKGFINDITFKRPLHNHEAYDVMSITITFDVEELGTIVFDADSDDVMRYIELAYANTVHKSQGSTLKDVILAVGRAPQLNSRQLIYTGMTRTQRTLTLVSSPNIISEAIDNDIEKNARLIYKDVIKEINQKMN